MCFLVSGRLSDLAELARIATRNCWASPNIALVRGPLQTLERCVAPRERSIDREAHVTGNPAAIAS